MKKTFIFLAVLSILSFQNQFGQIFRSSPVRQIKFINKTGFIFGDKGDDFKIYFSRHEPYEETEIGGYHESVDLVNVRGRKNLSIAEAFKLEAHIIECGAEVPDFSRMVGRQEKQYICKRTELESDWIDIPEGNFGTKLYTLTLDDSKKKIIVTEATGRNPFEFISSGFLNMLG